VEFRGPVRLGPGFSLDIPDNGTLVVGSGVDFRRGFTCEITGSGVVTIGDGTIFTSNVTIQCTTSIDIGRRCVFAQDVLLVDGKHRYGDPHLHSLEQGYVYRPIRIGDGAVVMSKSTVVADLGEGAFVGAHSLVTRPIPAHCLAFGTPAKPMEYFEAAAEPERVLSAER
jgi:acetyltransferase-like isoleucine patch superfamily enzyme